MGNWLGKNVFPAGHWQPRGLMALMALFHANMLTKQLDAHSPIARLHNEVLAMVFQFYVEDTVATDSKKRIELQKPELVDTKHESPEPRCLAPLLVCRRWYAVMISHPRLWTHVSLSTSEAFNTVIQRSGSLALDVENRRIPPMTFRHEGHPQALASLFDAALRRIGFKFTRHSEGRRPVLATLFENIDRIRSLDLVIREDLCHAFNEMLPCNASALESLTVTFYNARSCVDRLGPIGPSSKMPRLKYLKLNCCGLNCLSGAVRPTLTMLVIETPYPSQTSAAWLALLSELSALQTLNMMDLWIEPEVDFAKPLPKCSLPHLTSFTIGGAIFAAHDAYHLIPHMSLNWNHLTLVLYAYQERSLPPTMLYENLGIVLPQILPTTDHLHSLQLAKLPEGGINGFRATFMSYKFSNRKLSLKNDGTTTRHGVDAFNFVLDIAFRATDPAMANEFLPPMVKELAPVLGRVEKAFIDVDLPPQARDIIVSELPSTCKFWSHPIISTD